MSRLILKENSFQFNERHYLLIVNPWDCYGNQESSFNIFMAELEEEILSKALLKTYSLETLH